MKSAIILAAVAGFAGAAQADLITDWDLLGAVGTEAFVAPNSSAANVSGQNIVRGPGLLGSFTAANGFNTDGWGAAPAASPALDTDYVSFGFDVASGYQVDLTSLAIGTRSSNTGPGSLGLFSSADGFTTNLFTFTQVGTAFNNQIINLSSLTGLTGSVEFRIIQLGNTSANGGTTADGGTFRLTAYFVGSTFDQNINFQGTVSAVPAPGALALLGLGGLVAGRRRR
ncbi:MAG: PEP-CTERM sorting domain-containing protein [Phycisphaerales bacterium]|jgi:MYXO-CTERM domain-containing protein|nr:PEP-CTERM sorting domain-containing protein [Phycisphaerales bacterium]